MPFNLGRGKKAQQAEESEQPSDEAAEDLADPAAAEPDVEEEPETVEGTETAQAVEDEAEEPVQEERAQNRNRDREPVEPFSFRPSFLDDAPPAKQPKGKGAKVAASPAPRSGPFFVAVRDEKGNVSLQGFDERKDAEAHIELLLEDGVDPGTIVVHRGQEIGIQITKRPVVSFVNPEQA